MTINIRPENNADRAAVWNVNRAAFPTDAEADLVDALRDGGYGRVSLVPNKRGRSSATSSSATCRFTRRREQSPRCRWPRWPCCRTINVAASAADWSPTVCSRAGRRDIGSSWYLATRSSTRVSASRRTSHRLWSPHSAAERRGWRWSWFPALWPACKAASNIHRRLDSLVDRTTGIVRTMPA